MTPLGLGIVGTGTIAGTSASMADDGRPVAIRSTVDLPPLMPWAR